MSERATIEKLNTYCPFCDVEVVADVSISEGSLEVMGEKVAFEQHTAVCPHCGEAIGDSRIEGGNLSRAYDAYHEGRG